MNLPSPKNIPQRNMNLEEEEKSLTREKSSTPTYNFCFNLKLIIPMIPDKEEEFSSKTHLAVKEKFIK